LGDELGELGRGRDRRDDRGCTNSDGEQRGERTRTCSASQARADVRRFVERMTARWTGSMIWPSALFPTP